MRLVKILTDSLKLLFRRPKIYIPNLFASFLYTVFELVLIYYTLDLVYAVSMTSGYLSPGLIHDNMLPLIGLLLFYPFIGAIDLITYAMYPSMVSDYRSAGRVNLMSSLKNSLKSWRIILTFGLIIMFAFILLFFIVLFFSVLSLLLDEVYMVYISLPVILVYILVLMMDVFFLIPVGVIEEEGVYSSINKSLKLSIKHMREVFFLESFFMILVLSALSLGVLVNVGKINVGLTLTAVFLFIAVRLTQSVVYTYISVVNPYFYLERR